MNEGQLVGFADKVLNVGIFVSWTVQRRLPCSCVVSSRAPFAMHAAR